LKGGEQGDEQEEQGATEVKDKEAEARGAMVARLTC